MVLTMREKKALTNEIAVRYRKASKIDKQTLLDQFCRTTGYHRKYAVQKLNSWGKRKIQVIDGESVELVVGERRKARKRSRERVDDEQVEQALREVRRLFDFQCGKR